jgi:hypothetical protein
MIEDEMQRKVVRAYESSDSGVDLMADSRSRHIIIKKCMEAKPSFVNDAKHQSSPLSYPNFSPSQALRVHLSRNHFELKVAHLIEASVLRLRCLSVDRVLLGGGGWATEGIEDKFESAGLIIANWCAVIAERLQRREPFRESLPGPRE